MIECNGLSKRFAQKWILRQLHLVVPKGSFLCLFGANGVGKTTLMKLLAGLLLPTQGSVAIFGEKLSGGGHVWKTRVGLQTHESFLYPELTVAENLYFWGSLYDVESLQARVQALLEQFHLTAHAKQMVGTLSQGLEKRVSLARTALHDPDILLLDEPFSNLDMQSAEEVTHWLRSLHNTKKTVVLATHHLLAGLSLCNRVIVLKDQQIIFEQDRNRIDPLHFEKFYRSLWDKTSKN